MCTLAPEATQSALSALSALTLETQGKRLHPDDDYDEAVLHELMLTQIVNGWAHFYRQHGGDPWRLEYRQFRPGLDPTIQNGRAGLRIPYMPSYEEEEAFYQLKRYVKNKLGFEPRKHPYGTYWIEQTLNSLPPQWAEAILARKKTVEALFMEDVKDHTLSKISVEENATIRAFEGYMYERPEFHHILTSDDYNFKHLPNERAYEDRYINTKSSIEDLPKVLQEAIAIRRKGEQLAREEEQRKASNDAERHRLENVAKEATKRQLEEYHEIVQRNKRERAKKINLFKKVLGMDSKLDREQEAGGVQGLAEEDEEEKLLRIVGDYGQEFEKYVQQVHGDRVADIVGKKMSIATQTQVNLQLDAWPMTKVVQEMLVCVKKAADKINDNASMQRTECAVRLQLPSPLDHVDIRVAGLANYVDMRWAATFSVQEGGAIRTLNKLYAALNAVWKDMNPGQKNAAYRWYREFPNLPNDQDYLPLKPARTRQFKPSEKTDEQRMREEHERYTSDGWIKKKSAHTSQSISHPLIEGEMAQLLGEQGHKTQSG